MFFVICQLFVQNLAPEKLLKVVQQTTANLARKMVKSQTDPSLRDAFAFRANYLLSVGWGELCMSRTIPSTLKKIMKEKNKKTDKN